MNYEPLTIHLFNAALSLLNAYPLYHNRTLAVTEAYALM